MQGNVGGTLGLLEASAALTAAARRCKRGEWRQLTQARCLPGHRPAARRGEAGEATS